MKKLIVCAAIAAFLGGISAAEEAKTLRQGDLLRLIEALEQAGLKVEPEEDPAKLEEKHAALDQEEFKAALAQLQRPNVSVDYRRTDLADVLAELKAATGVNILLDPIVRETRGEILVDMNLDNVRPISVLRNVLRMYDLIGVYSDQALLITLPAQEEAITIVYDIHELTIVRDFSFPSRRVMHGMLSREEDRMFYRKEDAPQFKEPTPLYDADKLIEMLKAATPDGKWDDERYSVAHENGVLIVTNRPTVQIQVANILIALKTR